MLPLVSQVASTIHFNPNLEYLADRVAAYLTRDGRRKFNGELQPELLAAKSCCMLLAAACNGVSATML